MLIMPIKENLFYGKFKKLLISTDKLLEESKSLFEPIQNLKTEFENKSSSDFEISIQFFKIFLQSRYSYLNKKINLENILNQNKKFYGLPASIQTSFINWKNNSWNLKLINFNPNQYDMALAQSEGWRYISIDFESALEGSLVENTRDSFEHLLHDLAHSYMFFNDKPDFQKQVLFFKKLIQNYSFFETLLTDLDFKEKFYYCLSDMNSNSEHLKLYLKAILIEAFLKIENKNSFQKLSDLSIEKIQAVL